MILRFIAAATVIVAAIGVSEVSYADSRSHLRAISVAERHHLQQEVAQEDHTDHETPSPAPVDGQPPGERSPLVAVIAAVAIVVVGVTGIFIYRMIREGL